MFFVRIDFCFKGSHVQRTRDLVDGYPAVLEMLKTMTASGYSVIQVKIERCF